MKTLIIEDEIPAAKQLTKLLQQHDASYTVIETLDSVESAVRWLRIFPAPDLIFMDVVMPGVNGFQATRKLSADPETRSIPVIMVTSKDQESDRIWGMRQGAVDYLVKPVSANELIEKAQAALAS